jgi:hypothetical protein
LRGTIQKNNTLNKRPLTPSSDGSEGHPKRGKEYKLKKGRPKEGIFKAATDRFFDELRIMVDQKKSKRKLEAVSNHIFLLLDF